MSEGNTIAIRSRINISKTILTYTPSYEPADNFQKRLADVKLGADGTAEINIKTDYGYCQFKNHLEKLFIEPTELRKQLQRSLHIPNVEILNVDVNSQIVPFQD